jgi:NAD dependent epimerase/dehydratase family enzyme
MRTLALWQRKVLKMLLPTVVEATVGDNLGKGRKWRVWMVRQEVVVILFIISTLGCV